MVYLSLFITAFIAATLLPTASELMLGGLVTQNYNLILLWVSATLGNVLGSCVNWWLGLKLHLFKDHSWFFFSQQQIAKAERQFSRYGKYSLLFSWLPIIGDPLTLIAGLLRVNFVQFIILVTIGKALRYLFVIVATLGFVNLA